MVPVEQAVLPVSVEPATIDTDAASYKRQIALLEQKAATATTADDIKQYFDIIADLRRQKAELEQVPQLAQRREDEAVETRRMQISAAVLCWIPGMSLIVAAAALHNAPLAASGVPLIAISAAALSERTANVVRSWLGRKWDDNAKQ